MSRQNKLLRNGVSACVHGSGVVSRATMQGLSRPVVTLYVSFSRFFRRICIRAVTPWGLKRGAGGGAGVGLS